MKKYAIRHKVNIFSKPSHEDDLYIGCPVTFDSLEDLYGYFFRNYYEPYKNVILGYQKEREEIPNWTGLGYSEQGARIMHGKYKRDLDKKYHRLLQEYLDSFEIIEVSHVEIFDVSKFQKKNLVD